MNLTGHDLRKARKARGLNQAELGSLSGFGRHTVSYWENKPLLGRWGACEAMCNVLNLPLPRWTRWPQFRDEQRNAMSRKNEVEPQDCEAHEVQRVVCGAKTRKGHPCRAFAEPGKQRCRLHGGVSTGPKTDAGKKAISDAQKRRWAAYRAQKSQDQLS